MRKTKAQAHLITNMGRGQEHYRLGAPPLGRLLIATAGVAAAVGCSFLTGQTFVYYLIGLAVVCTLASLVALTGAEHPIPLVALTLSVLLLVATGLTKASTVDIAGRVTAKWNEDFGWWASLLVHPGFLILLACVVLSLSFGAIIKIVRVVSNLIVMVVGGLPLLLGVGMVLLLLRLGVWAAVGAWALTLITALTAASLRLDGASDQQEVVVEDRSWPCVQLWNKYLAWFDEESGRGGPLGAFRLLEPPTDVMDQRDGVSPVGWEATVVCPPASKGAEVVRAASSQIATTMQVSPADIEVIQTSNHARPLLRVIHRSVLAGGSVPWTSGGVDESVGTIELGTYADGMRSKYQLWEANGQTWHGWFCGGTGSGKSTAMHGLLGRALGTGQVVLDLTAIGGGSMYAWRDRSFRYGDTVADAELALERGVAVMDARSRAAADIEWWDARAEKMRRGRDPLPPGAEWPIYWVVIDEFPRLKQAGRPSTAKGAPPSASANFKRIAAEGRKWRVALLVASQGATLKETWWDDSAIRENVRQGNVAVFRGSRGSASLALDGIEVAAGIGDIPPGVGGTGYIISKASQRSMLSRVDWVADDDDRPKLVPSSFEVADLVESAKPNFVDLRAIGEAERSAAARAA